MNQISEGIDVIELVEESGDLNKAAKYMKKLMLNSELAEFAPDEVKSCFRFRHSQVLR